MNTNLTRGLIVNGRIYVINMISVNTLLDIEPRI